MARKKKRGPERTWSNRVGKTNPRRAKIKRCRRCGKHWAVYHVCK